ncbi:MAG: response regulator transcription factor [Anaerolineaceae bacterium]|nr:response regulator transcription factor [Anaerolineaceae bacterium]
MIKLMIADDDAKVRSAINLLLDQDRACWQVVAEVRTVNELFLTVEKIKPKLLLLDWELPEECCGGIQPTYISMKDRLNHLRKINPGMYIIVLSSKPQVKTEALIAGANSFVSKGDPPEVFLNALYSICEEPLIIASDDLVRIKKRRKPVSLFL